MKLYIINLIWSRQCWRPASSVSGRTPAVSNSAQGNAQNVREYQEEMYLKALQDSESLPSFFSYTLPNRLPAIYTPLCVSASLGVRILFCIFQLRDTCPTSSQTTTCPYWPIHLILSMGYCKIGFIRPTEEDAQIMQLVEDTAAPLPKPRYRHCKENYCTQNNSLASTL